MDGIREKVLEKLSEALVACGDNIVHREYVTNLKAMMASEGSTKQGFLMFLSLALDQMSNDCEACAALVSIKSLLESEEEVTAAGGTEQSEAATGCFHDTLVDDQIETCTGKESHPEAATGTDSPSETATGKESHPEAATGTESHPETATGTESHPETVDDVKDLKLPQSLSQGEVDDLLRSFGVLTEENGWTSVSYGADLDNQGRAQRILSIKYGALNVPVIGFKDLSTGESRVFVAFEHIKRGTVAEVKVKPFKFTYYDREPWWLCDPSRFGRSERAMENTRTFQSITMPGMGIRILARVAKKEVKAKRGETVLCPPSWDMDTIDRLCELTPNTKDGYKRHVMYLLLVELDTNGKNLQEVQSAPRVKTSGNVSVPLWSPVVEHWDLKEENLFLGSFGASPGVNVKVVTGGSVWNGFLCAILNHPRVSEFVTTLGQLWRRTCRMYRLDGWWFESSGGMRHPYTVKMGGPFSPDMRRHDLRHPWVTCYGNARHEDVASLFTSRDGAFYRRFNALADISRTQHLVNQLRERGCPNLHGSHDELIRRMYSIDGLNYDAEMMQMREAEMPQADYDSDIDWDVNEDFQDSE